MLRPRRSTRSRRSRAATSTPAVSPRFIGRDARQPFALIVASTEPHQPWSKGDPSRYDAASLELPPYFVDTPETREALTRYYAEITFMDGQLGRVLDLLREHADPREHADHVLQRAGGSAARWRSGRCTKRASAPRSSPAGVAGFRPARPQPRCSRSTTSCRPGSRQPAAPSRPRSRARACSTCCWSRGPKHRDLVYGIQTTTGIIANLEPYPIRSIRDERYKLIWNITHENRFTNLVTEENRDGFYFSWRDAGETDPAARALYERYQHRPEFEFFDLAEDPHELTNLAEAPEHRRRLEEMHARLRAWMEDQGDLGLQTEIEAPEHQSRPR